MVSWKIKVIVASLAVATIGQSFPQEADAFIFRWLRQRRAARVAYYAGYTPAVAQPRVAGFAPTLGGACGAMCNSCPTSCVTTQRVCTNVPQTCYRTVYRQVPVTVYRPVTTVDPCTGCPTTCMHPCTTVQHVAQRVPVTTYRQVCQLVQRPVTPTCNTCAPAVPVVQQQYAPVQQFAAPAQQFAPATPGCANCGRVQIPAIQTQPYAPAPATQLAPVNPTPAGPTTNLAPNNNNGNAPANTIPSLQNNPPANNPIQGSSNRSSVPFQPRIQNPDIRPLPDLDRAPALLNPDDRTASRVAPGTIMPISWQTNVSSFNGKPKAAETTKVYSTPAAQPASPKVRRLDASGWVPAGNF